VNRRFLIEGSQEREKYLSSVCHALSHVDTIVLAYCLMSSHVHLVVRAGRDPLSRLMKSVHSGFAVWLNNRHRKKDGAVFSGRYRSILVDEDAYLLELVRYVHNNPVRARVVSSAARSDWSSHRAYLGLEAAPAWLNTGYVLSMVNRTPGWARRQFERFVEEGKDEKRRPDLNGEESPAAARRLQKAYGDAWRISGPIVGSEAFAAKVLEDIAKVDGQTATRGALRKGVAGARPTLDELIAVTCATVGVDPWVFAHQPKKELSALARRAIVFLWVNAFGGTQIEVARKLTATTPAVSKWHSRAVETLPDMEPLLDEIKGRFPSWLEGVDTSNRIRYVLDVE
jgi:REP element-mobilizing transposase RayT